jgi:formate hydrogenlyase subunit 4
MNVLHFIFALIFSPLLFGIINKVKAFFAGRKGPPLLQLYYTLFKLLHKGRIYSKTTTPIFQLTPFIGLCSLISITLFIPFAGNAALISFSGDIIIVIYLFALFRLCNVLAALDTGSSFEAMGASRDVSFAVFAEATLLLSFTICALQAHSISLSTIYQYFSLKLLHPIIILVGIALFIVLVTESCRIPVDDPNTHLELTMIHEVMVLDHSSVELGVILYSSYLKLWLLCSLLVGLFLPTFSIPWLKELYFISAITVNALIIGIVESIMARFRFNKIFDLVLTGLALTVFAFILQIVRML